LGWLPIQLKSTYPTRHIQIGRNTGAAAAAATLAVYLQVPSASVNFTQRLDSITEIKTKQKNNTKKSKKHKLKRITNEN